MADNSLQIGLSWEPKLSPLCYAAKTVSTGGGSGGDTIPQTSALYKPDGQLIDGLFLPPNQPKKLNKLLRKQVKDTSGKNWFDMPAPTMTPELKKELQLLNLRDVMDPKRHYKKGASKSKALPKYFQVGTVIESASDFFSGRLTKKERKSSIADALLSDQTLGQYRKRKVREIEERNRPGGNDKWKIKGRESRMRAKHRRH